MGSVLTSMASVPALVLLDVGESTESTVSSWKTGEETSSCLIGLKEIPQKIHSEAKQKLIYHNTLHTIVKRYTHFKFSCSVCLLIRSGDATWTKKYSVNKHKTKCVAFLSQTG